MSACKTRSPTVGLRKLDRLRGTPGPPGLGGDEAKQAQADCPPCGASPQGDTHTVGTRTVLISRLVAFKYTLAFSIIILL